MYLKVILEQIEKKNFMHYRRTKKFIDNMNQNQINESEVYLEKYFRYMKENNIELTEVIDAYLEMVASIIEEQIYFLKNSRYRYSTISETSKLVYHNHEYMIKYMMGVALSQFLWENHYKMFQFYKNNIINIGERKSYAEIGVGHGLFFNEALNNGKFEEYTAIDISDTSLNLTKQIVENNKNKKINWVLQDIIDVEIENEFDFIAMGEVLEHVENPKAVLQKICKLLKKEGKAFISTCANAPVIDHIYLFNNIDEIRNIIELSGLEILDEEIISIDNIPEKEWIKEKANVSYAAIVKRK